MRTLARWSAIALVLALGTSCDKCIGAEVCPSDWRLQIVGTVVDEVTGAPIKGANIEVTFSGTAGSQVVSAVTDRDGRWTAKGDADCCDHFRASVVVAAPGVAPYLVPDFPVRTLKTKGDAMHVGVWTSRPFIRYLASPLHNNVDPLPSAAIHFEPLAGIPIAGPLDVVTDGAGTFRIDAITDRLGDVVGILTITHPSLIKPVKIFGFIIPAGHTYELPRPKPIAVYDR